MLSNRKPIHPILSAILLAGVSPLASAGQARCAGRYSREPCPGAPTPLVLATYASKAAELVRGNVLGLLVFQQPEPRLAGCRVRQAEDVRSADQTFARVERLFAL